jgi:hypothetical protein
MDRVCRAVLKQSAAWMDDVKQAKHKHKKRRSQERGGFILEMKSGSNQHKVKKMRWCTSVVVQFATRTRNDKQQCDEKPNKKSENKIPTEFNPNQAL